MEEIIFICMVGIVTFIISLVAFTALKNSVTEEKNYETTDVYKRKQFSNAAGYRVAFTDEYIQCYTKEGTEILFRYWEILKIKCGVLGLDINGIGKNFLMAVAEEDREIIKKLVSFAKTQMKNTTQKEYRVKCNVCGHIYCFTNEDVKKSDLNQSLATMHSVSSALNAIGGTAYNMHEEQKHADAANAKIIDFSKCPKCNSSDVIALTNEEWQKINSTSESTTDTISAADEIKKFKELLDNGTITQEEFDTKKKQLLGL